MTLSEILNLPVQSSSRLVRASDAGTYCAIEAGQSGAQAVILASSASVQESFDAAVTDSLLWGWWAERGATRPYDVRSMVIPTTAIDSTGVALPDSCTSITVVPDFGASDYGISQWPMLGTDSKLTAINCSDVSDPLPPVLGFLNQLVVAGMSNGTFSIGSALSDGNDLNVAAAMTTLVSRGWSFNGAGWPYVGSPAGLNYSQASSYPSSYSPFIWIDNGHVMMSNAAGPDVDLGEVAALSSSTGAPNIVNIGAEDFGPSGRFINLVQYEGACWYLYSDPNDYSTPGSVGFMEMNSSGPTAVYHPWGSVDFEISEGYLQVPAGVTPITNMSITAADLPLYPEVLPVVLYETTHPEKHYAFELIGVGSDPVAWWIRKTTYSGSQLVTATGLSGNVDLTSIVTGVRPGTYTLTISVAGFYTAYWGSHSLVIRGDGYSDASFSDPASNDFNSMFLAPELGIALGNPSYAPNPQTGTAQCIVSVDTGLVVYGSMPSQGDSAVFTFTLVPS